MRALSFCLVLGLSLAAASTASADQGCCATCGCNCCVQKVCVCKKIEKEITKTCWDVKCEDVCVPGRSCLCGEVCQQDKCGCWYYNLWKPSCAYVKTRHVPVKAEVKRKVPSYEWMVEYRCANCCGGNCGQPAGGADQTPADQAPAPAPEAAARIPYAPAPAATQVNFAEAPSARRAQK